MSVARVTEIKASSTKGFDDAIKVGVARAHKTLKNVKSAWIENQEVLVDDKRTNHRVPGPDEGDVYSRRLNRKYSSCTRFRGYLY